jgi:hypothetical protein
MQAWLPALMFKFEIVCWALSGRVTVLQNVASAPGTRH